MRMKVGADNEVLARASAWMLSRIRTRTRLGSRSGVRSCCCASLLIVSLLSAAFPILTLPAGATQGADSPPEVRRAVESSDRLTPFIIVLAQQPDYEVLHARVRGLDHQARRHTVAVELRELAARTQGPVKDELARLEDQGQASGTRPLWMVNAVAAELSGRARESLESLPGVLLVEQDRALAPALDEPDACRPELGEVSSVDTSWAIHHVRADRVWRLGFRGQGRVVGMIDTGINYKHFDLAHRMWINGPEDINNNGYFESYPDSLGGDLNDVDDDGNGFLDDVVGWNFEESGPDPMDDHGHGTATASIVAGDGWAGVATGLAPEARVMALKVQLTSEFIAAMEYGVENGADLLSSSLVIPCHPTPSYSLRLAGNTLLASGTVLSQAAGNEGGYGGQYCPFPPPDEVDPPADVPAPWYPSDGSGIYIVSRHSGVLAVGASVPEDTVAYFSSRGPTDWDLAPPFDDYPFPPGLAKPDVAAPGVGLPAALLTSNWGYNYNFSGTSAAAPVNAGVVSLMLSAVPSLMPVAIDSILEATAFDIDPPGRDSSSGAGRIDAYRAVGTMRYSYPEVIGWTILDDGGDGDGRAEPGETVDWVITFLDSALWQPSAELYCYLSTDDPEIILVDSSASFGDIESGKTGDNADDPFTFTVSGGPARWATFYLRKIDGTPVVPDNLIDTLDLLIGHPSLLAVDDDGEQGFAPFYDELLRDTLGLVYDGWEVRSQGLPTGWLGNADLVLWFTGAAPESTLTQADQVALGQFLDQGGDLLLCGDNIAEEIAERPFLLDYLHTRFDSGATSDTLITGISGDPIGDGLLLVRDGPASMDVISPVAGGSTVLEYEHWGAAGVRHEGEYRSLFLAFAPELVREPSPEIQGGVELLRRALCWFGAVGVAEQRLMPVHRRHFLSQNAPNPVRHTTTITYSIPAGQRVRLRIYNMQGQLVRELVDGMVRAGIHRVDWDGLSAGGRRAASGIYLYSLEVGTERRTRKMVVLH